MESRFDNTKFQDAVQGIYRLFKVATFHRLDNDAVSRAIDLSLQSVRAFGERGQGLSMLFARDTVIVNGRLLQASPATYELAMEFGGFLVGAGINSFAIDSSAVDADLRALLEYFRERLRFGEEIAAGGIAADSEPVYRVVPGPDGSISPAVKLRHIKEHLLLGLEDPRLSAFERVLLTYALAIRVIRQLHSRAVAGDVSLPSFFKRVSRQLALADYGSRPVLLDIMLAGSSSTDQARLAVNASIVAVAMVRRIARDEQALSRVALSSMMLDIGHHLPHLAARASGDDALALATATAQMVAGELRGDTVGRTLVGFEAVQLRAGCAPDGVWFGQHQPGLDAYVVATARRFVDAVAAGWRSGLPGDRVFAEAATAVMSATPDAMSLRVARLLLEALGLVTHGVVVQLERGALAVVTAPGVRPSLFDRPRVWLVSDADGRPIQPMAVDLSDAVATDVFGPVARVVLEPAQWIVDAATTAGLVSDFVGMGGAAKTDPTLVLGTLQRPTPVSGGATVRIEATEVTRPPTSSGSFASATPRDFADAPTAPPSARRGSISGATSAAPTERLDQVAAAATAAATERLEPVNAAQWGPTVRIEAVPGPGRAVVPATERLEPVTSPRMAPQSSSAAGSAGDLGRPAAADALATAETLAPGDLDPNALRSPRRFVDPAAVGGSPRRSDDWSSSEPSVASRRQSDSPSGSYPRQADAGFSSTVEMPAGIEVPTLPAVDLPALGEASIPPVQRRSIAEAIRDSRAREQAALLRGDAPPTADAFEPTARPEAAAADPSSPASPAAYAPQPSYADPAAQATPEAQVEPLAYAETMQVPVQPRVASSPPPPVAWGDSNPPLAHTPPVQGSGALRPAARASGSQRAVVERESWRTSGSHATVGSRPGSPSGSFTAEASAVSRSVSPSGNYSREAGRAVEQWTSSPSAQRAAQASPTVPQAIMPPPEARGPTPTSSQQVADSAASTDRPGFGRTSPAGQAPASWPPDGATSGEWRATPSLRTASHGRHAHDRPTRQVISREVIRPRVTTTASVSVVDSPRPAEPLSPLRRALETSGGFESVVAERAARPQPRPSAMPTQEIEALLSSYLTESGAGDPGDDEGKGGA